MVEMTGTTASRQSVWSTIKRYGVLAYGALGTMLDVGLMVLGSLLVGISIAVLLAGFGLVDTTLGLSTAPLLISAIVLAVSGLFCLGVASEGPLGRGRRLAGFALWEVGVGRSLSVFGVGLGGLLLYSLLQGLLNGLPAPLLLGAEGVRSVAVAGMTTMPLLGVPASLVARGLGVRHRWAKLADVPLMFIIWTVAAMMLLT